MLRVCLKTVKLFCLTMCMGLCLVKQVMASDYQQGLAAYIDGEFALAQQYWLKAANAQDAKSMFNLGLLHEQNKLEAASIDKALNWYKVAADNGYAPAGYHLAQRMFERGGSDDEAIALIKRAADSGYAPAKRYLGLGQVSVKAQQPKRASTSADKAGEVGTGYRSEKWINRQSGQNWTIQLLAFKSKQQVLDFIKQYGLQRNAAYFLEVKDGDVFYKLVYGSFDSKDKATFARQNLSTSLQAYGPWLRTWASIQGITKP